MPQERALVLDELGGSRVQLHPAQRPELLVDGGLHQRMRERDFPDAEVLPHLQQPGDRRLVERGEQIGHPGQGGGRPHRRGGAEHGDGLHEAPCRRTGRRQPPQHLRGEGARRGQ